MADRNASGVRWLGGLLAALVLIGCQPTAETVSDADVVEVSYPELVAMLAGPQGLNRGTVLVDVRQPREYLAGRLPGAVLAPLSRLQADDPRLEDAQAVIVYGENPEDPRPTVASKRLLVLGFENVRVFRGGIERWTREGGELEVASSE